MRKTRKPKLPSCGGANGTFCAGYDLHTIGNDEGSASLSSNSPRLNADERTQGPMGPSRLHIKKPIIAAVSGYAVAGGLELSLLCDIRIAEEDAVFGVFCRRWGVPLIDGGTVRLPSDRWARTSARYDSYGKACRCQRSLVDRSRK